MSGDDFEVVWPGAFERLRTDPAFGPVVEEVGRVRMPPPRWPHFRYLCRSIIHQQLAGKAAATIHGRFEEALGGDVEPEGVLAVAEARLKGAGLSPNKLRAIRDLARKVSGGELELDGIDALPDPEVADRLTKVWGIGRWTAEMFLLFQLRRPDVWPVGDLGVRSGFARIMSWDERPDAAELELAGVGYRPWRSAVAWYCWRVMDG